MTVYVKLCVFVYWGHHRLTYRILEGNHPCTSIGVFVPLENYSASICHSTVIFCRLYFTSGIAKFRTTDNSDCAARPGMMCPSLAFTGNCGIASMYVAVDTTCAQSGTFMIRELIAGCTFDFVAAVTKK